MKVRLIIINQFGVFKSTVLEGLEAESVKKTNWQYAANAFIVNESGEKVFFPETIYKNSVVRIENIED